MDLAPPPRRCWLLELQGVQDRELQLKGEQVSTVSSLEVVLGNVRRRRRRKRRGKGKIERVTDSLAFDFACSVALQAINVGVMG
jgi:hypothetical protein